MKKVYRWFLILSFLLTSCNQVNVFTYQVSGYFVGDEYIFPMNTISQITIYQKQNQNKITAYFQQKVTELSKLFDRYHEYEELINLKTINDSCGKEITYVLPESLYYAIKMGVTITKLSKGKYNIAMGSLIDLYQPLFDENDTIFKTLPEQNLICNALNCIPSYQEIDQVIELNDQKKSIKLNRYHQYPVCLSLGSIAKGSIIDEILKYLKTFDESLFIDAGNSTIALLNKNPLNLKQTWNIALKNPTLNQQSDLLCKLTTTGTTFLSTSGDYTSNFFYQDEQNQTKLMHHILDPDSGVSNNDVRMVNVISSDAPLALLDALTTAIFNLKENHEILSLIHNIEELYSCHIDVLLVKPTFKEEKIEFNEYHIEMSKGYQNYIQGNFSDNVKKISLLDE